MIPPTATSAWIEAVTGRRIERTESLAGGISSTVAAVTLQGDDIATLVLRRFTDNAWLEIEPDLAAHEAYNLELAAAAEIPAPRLVAFDAAGTIAAEPSVLMTAMPGGVDLTLRSDNWAQQLAAALLPIHDVVATDHPWRFAHWYDGDDLTPPAWTDRPDLWHRAFEVSRQNITEPPHHWIHRDFHPANVLWTGWRIGAIVDWVNACRGPAYADVGHCRLNLANLHGLEAADRFLAAYEDATGKRQHPVWDLRMAFTVLPGPDDVYRGWTELGARHLDLATMRDNLERYVESVTRKA